MSGTRMMVVFTALLVNVTAGLPAAQICEFNGSCGAGEYCKKPDEACFSTGTCEPSPTTCQLILSPVCGCDQKTYSNSCFARTAGVSIARFGACDCRESSDCATDEFCEKEDGDCDGVGACTAKPVACSTDPDPVCGCDGVTYENVCLAAVAGASVAYEGACTTTCARNSECGTGQFCQKYAGHCQGLGSCQAKPLFCPITENLVCGCDGQTYSNACKASLAGVSVMSSGSCGDSCTSNTACADWQYCDRIDGICGGDGVCRTMPTVGPTTFDPVCGCDGHSYDNASMAATAGTTVVAFDPCPIFGHGFEPGSTEGWSSTVQ